MMKRYGFTLVELMVVIFIFSIIMAATFAVLSIGRQSWHTGSTQVELQQETRRAMDRMVKELRQSGQTTIVGVLADGNPYFAITFQLPEDAGSDDDALDGTGNIEWGNQITYSLAGNQVQRASAGSTTILANKVATLEFKRSPDNPMTPDVDESNIIEISLQAQKDALPGGRQMQSTLNSQVTLRN